MSPSQTLHFETHPKPIPQRTWRIASVVVSAISMGLFVAVFSTNSRRPQILVGLLFAIALVLCIVLFLHARFLLHLRRQHRKIVVDLRTTGNEIHRVQKQLALNRALVKSASAEAEALRKTTSTLTRDMQLDQVLDVLLQSLAELVPYESAEVLLLEDDSRLFVARDRSLPQTETSSSGYPAILNVANFPLLERVLKDQEPLFLQDVTKENKWRALTSGSIRSWLCLPLVAVDRTLGILCADHTKPNAFTAEHLRVAKSLAVSAAAGIQNSRLFERAEIYGSELEKRLSDLQDTRTALEHSQRECLISEERFQKVFRSSPIAFSITTVDTGRFLDVNVAFEQRYGYSRSELIGRTVHELGFWENGADRALMINQLDRGVAVRNVITQLRTKSGESKLTSYSADRISFDGEACVLVVSGDVPIEKETSMN